MRDQPRCFSPPADGLVPRERARAALAREVRPIPHLGRGDHAAADAGGCGGGALQRVPAALSHAGLAGFGQRVRGAGGVVRVGLLQPRAAVAQGGAVHRGRAQGTAAGDGGGAAHAAWDRRVHGGGDRKHCVWGGRCGGGWQRGAGGAAAHGPRQREHRRRAGVRARPGPGPAAAGARDGIAAGGAIRRRPGHANHGQPCGRPQSGDDGAGRDGLSAARAALQRVPCARVVPHTRRARGARARAAAQPARRLPAGPAQARPGHRGPAGTPARGRQCDARDGRAAAAAAGGGGGAGARAADPPRHHEYELLRAGLQRAPRGARQRRQPCQHWQAQRGDGPGAALCHPRGRPRSPLDAHREPGQPSAYRAYAQDSTASKGYEEHSRRASRMTGRGRGWTRRRSAEGYPCGAPES